MESIHQQIIRQKLTLIKQLVTKDKNGKKFVLANRDKNRSFMLEYGLLINDIKDILLNLEVEDYYKGPEKEEASYEDEI